MVFPQSPLPTFVEIRVNDAWVDITEHALERGPITITGGRGDEGADADPGKCSFQLSNRDGRYSPFNALGPYYGQLDGNTPVRVGVAEANSWMPVPGGRQAVGATTPDTPALDVTGDLDVRLDMTLMNWVTSGVDNSVELCGKSTQAGNQKSWALMLRDSRLHFEWSADGAFLIEVDSTSALTIPRSGRLAVRVTLEVEVSGVDHEVRFYTAPTSAGPWTLLGFPIVGPGVTSIYSSTAPLTCGNAVVGFNALAPRGQIHSLQVRNGIDGSIVAWPRFDELGDGVIGFSDPVGRNWDVFANSAIKTRRIRFYGEIPAWPPRQDELGEDEDEQALGDMWVPIEAAGILRRLNQAGVDTLKPALVRAITSPDSPAPPAAFWALADGDGSTQAASALPAKPPMVKSGTAVFGQQGTPPGGGDTGAGSGDGVGVLTGQVLAQEDTAARLISFWVDVPADVGDHGIALSYASPTSTIRTTTVFVAGAASDDANNPVGNLGVQTIDSAGANSAVGNPLNGADLRGTGPRNITIVDWDDAGTHKSDIYLDGQYANTYLGAFGAALNPVTTVRVGTLPVFILPSPATAAGTISNVVVAALPNGWNFVDWGEEAARIYGAGTGWEGETARARILRLGAEEDIPVDTGLSAATTPTLGPQGAEALVDILQEAAGSDGGILFERRDALGLVLRDHGTLINQPVAMTIAYSDTVPPIEPTPDDAFLVNDATATRPGGSSARWVLENGPRSVLAFPDGVGRYPKTIDANVDDALLIDSAGWAVHLGTHHEHRYPLIRLDLAVRPDLIPIATMLTPGDRFVITDPPSQITRDPIDVLAQGYTETLDVYEWTIDLNTSPAKPWDTGVWDAATRGRWGTAGAALAHPIDADQTDIWVATTQGPVWVNSDITLTANPDVEANSTGWGGQGGTMARVDTEAKAGFWSLRFTPDGVATFPGLFADQVPAVAGTSYRASGWGRCVTARVLDLNVNWFTGGGSYIQTSTVSLAVAANTWTWFDGILTAPATTGNMSLAPTIAPTPPATDVMHWDDVRIRTTTTSPSLPFNVMIGGELMTVTAISDTTSPQIFTVVRAVNGIRKPHTQDTSVALADRMILSY